MKLDNPSINLRTVWNSSDKNTKNLLEMLTAAMQFLGATIDSVKEASLEQKWVLRCPNMFHN